MSARGRARARLALAVATAAVLAGGVTTASSAIDGTGTATADGPPSPPALGDPAGPAYGPQLAAAALEYRRYVVAEATALRERTARFVAAVTAGRTATARRLYPGARRHWEHIQVAAEGIGDLADAIDGHGVGLGPDEPFTGFHRLERDLWLDGPQPDTDAVARRLLADVTALGEAAATARFTGHDLCGGAKELIDFAVVTTLQGRENPYAGTDLADLAARVEGSRAVVDVLRPLLAEVHPALLDTLDRRFAEAFAVLDTYRAGGAYVPFPELTGTDLKAVADALDGVGEPVSRLGATVMV